MPDHAKPQRQGPAFARPCRRSSSLRLAGERTRADGVGPMTLCGGSQGTRIQGSLVGSGTASRINTI